MSQPALILKPGREKAVLRKHPWIFSGAIDQVVGKPALGETVRILDSKKNFLAWAAYSQASQIRARIWSWEIADLIDDKFFYDRLLKAIEYRRNSISTGTTNAMRLVNAESDGLPGLILDQYENTLVMQCTSAGIERWQEVIADLSMEITGADWLYERSDVPVRAMEGLSERIGLLRSKDATPSASFPETIKVFENDVSYWVDVAQGQKTGFYLDQRRNRAIVGELANCKEVLDCFAYTGGFTISALNAGAKHVVAVDSSPDALRMVEKNLDLNKISLKRVTLTEGDVFQVLREYRDRRLKFDMIVLDPPKFAPTEAQVRQAARGYKDINLLAFKLLVGGGFLVTFSCSGAIDADLFQKIVAGAALDAGVNGVIAGRLYQDIDHPVGIHFPEANYLKGFIIQVV